MVIDLWIWAILLLVLGLGLATLECFFPSAGILGFLSACSILAAVFMGFRQGPTFGVLILLVAVVGLPVLIAAAFKVWPKTAVGRRILLMPPEGDEVLPDDPRLRQLKSLVGQVGRAKSKMLPGGVVVIDGRSVDAVSEGAPVETGEFVRVVKVRANRLVVRRVEDAPPSQAARDPLMQPVEDPFADDRPS